MKKLMTSICLSVSAVTVAGIYGACSHENVAREVASSSEASATSTEGTISPLTLATAKRDAEIFGGQVHFAPGLTREEAIDLWHLSEGSDVFPLTWFVKMKSLTTNISSTHLYEALDQKFGVIPEPAILAQQSPYPFKWVGISSAWSGEHPVQADVRLVPPQDLAQAEIVRTLSNGQKSIAMVGVNCAFCHTNAITVHGKSRIVEGAPDMVNIRGFFQDLFASTAKTMLMPNLLEDFLRDMQVSGDVHVKAHEFSKQLTHDLGLDSPLQVSVGAVLNILDQPGYARMKTETLRKTFFKRKDVVAKYLTKLLQMTYGLETVPQELQLRMKFLADSIGVDPNLPVTPEGFDRTDAFGRISNLVARTKNPIPLTATSSLPPMWNIGYRAYFHWNANTNSVIMRNIGQSFGLGSILTNPNGKGTTKYDATSNLHNLHTLEGMIYKVRAPRYEDFANDVDLPKAVAGCNLYYKTCAKCHTPDRQRVGPTQELIAHRVFPLDAVGTDPQYTINQSTPVNGVPFKDALFGFTRAIRARYYERYQIPADQQAIWEHRELRGPELFRDTYLGEKGNTGVSTYMNISMKDANGKFTHPGYPARPLASVWATAPYLHNGSVPNMMELLTPAPERRKIFFVGSRDYDTTNLGFRSDFQSLPPVPDLENRAKALMSQQFDFMSLIKGVQTKSPASMDEARIQAACDYFPERCFHTGELGNSNSGHEGPDYGTTFSLAEKTQLIEFLKILRPEPEYSDPNAIPHYQWNPEQQSCQAL